MSIELLRDPVAVIFDLDGTLLDTEPLYTQAMQKVLDPFGHTYTMALKRKVMGGDSRRSAQLTIDEFDLPMTPEELLAARQVYLEQLFPQAPEIAGAGRYIEHLNALGVPVGIATGSHSHLCELKLNHRAWKPLLSAIVCGNDGSLVRGKSVRGKPEPDIFLLCAQRMGVDPARTLAFEDSRNGVLAARAAGMTVVAIESPYTTREDLAGADIIIPDYHHLLDG